MNIDEEVVRLYPWMMRVANRMCANNEDAEDLVGDTVYKILSNRERFNYNMDLKPWCIAIMANTNKTKLHHNSLVLFVDYDSAYDIPSLCPAIDRAAIKNILSIIRKCARQTNTMQCVIYCAKGYSYDEISMLENIPVGTVKSRISFGRRLLRLALNYNVK